MTTDPTPAAAAAVPACGHRSRHPRNGLAVIASAVALVVVVAVGGCGGGSSPVTDAGPAPTRPVATTTPPTTTPPTTTPPTTTPPSPSTSVAASPPRPTTTVAPPPTSTVMLWFVRGGVLQAVNRPVPKVARIGAEAVAVLLVGPTADDVKGGLTTAIPSGTRLLGLVIADGVARVDLSAGFESAGEGDRSLGLRLAQVTCTLDQFDTVDAVGFSLDGRAVSVLRGDGTVSDRPVTCDNYRQLLVPPAAPITTG